MSDELAWGRSGECGGEGDNYCPLPTTLCPLLLQRLEDQAGDGHAGEPEFGGGGG